MESYHKAVLGETNRKQPYEGHHSHPTFLGGRRDQKLTDLPVHTHRRIHKDINQFMGMSGIQTAGNSAKDINTAFKDKKDVLKERLADFHLYGGACGGARDEYKPAAEDFFRQHPHLRKDAEKRMSDLKAEVAKHPARDEAKVIAAFYKDLDAKNNRK